MKRQCSKEEGNSVKKLSIVKKDSLSYEYGKLFSDRKAWEYFRHLEKDLKYLKKEESMIEIYGKKYTSYLKDMQFVIS